MIIKELQKVAENMFVLGGRKSTAAGSKYNTVDWMHPKVIFKSI